MDYQWLADGVTEKELNFLSKFDDLVRDDSEAAREISGGTLAPYLLGLISESAGKTVNFPWLTDGVNMKELPAVIGIGRLAKLAPDLADRLLGYSWLADGASDRESDGINHLANIARVDLELARQVVGMGILDDPLRDRGLHAIIALARVAGIHDLAPLINQPWFVDGLNDEETAFLAVMDMVLVTGHQDILQKRFTGSATISLPLAGNVDVWAFWNSPFPASDDTVELIEDAARASEILMGVPFPTTDIIILLGDPERVFSSGAHFGNHMAAQRWVGEGNLRGVIYHETAHYYYMGVHSWFNEGFADLVVTYTAVQKGLRDLEERIDDLEENDNAVCAEKGLRNIQEVIDHQGDDTGGCHYNLGEFFLVSLFELLGEEAMSASLKELYLMRQPEVGGEPTEADLYRIFLKHTPPALKDEFRDLYRRLHGGPAADTDT